MNANYKLYLNQVLKYSLLTPEQERELSYRVQFGDEKAKNELITRNLRLVVNIARRYCDSNTNLMDLVQEGNIGLMTAAQKYHYSYNTRFSTYAYAWIAQSIFRYIQTKSQLIPIPVRKDEIIHKIETARLELFNKFSRDPTDEELAEYTGINLDLIIKSKKYVFFISSMDREIDTDSGLTLGEMMADDKANPEEDVFNNCKRTIVNDLVKSLQKNERLVIQNRYCLVSPNHKTLRQIGAMLGISAETVRQTEKRAIKKMRIAVNSNAELYM
ncbi:MAG: hypothetical protein BKP49_00285 [Treponema sp. CETP13]|nr:MAG: hypothetical protein BKP49_00285 [Treponema sp. CETP13]